MLELGAFAGRLFAYLRRMDADASTAVEARAHAGLVSYHMHRGMGIRKHESACCEGISECLQKDGFFVESQVHYPGVSRNRCDLVVTLENRERLWLEVKAAWKAWFDPAGHVRTNSQFYYNKYLWGSRVDRKCTHSAIQDIEKLNCLLRSDAGFAAELLIGFDTATDPMDADVERLVSDLGLQAKGWDIHRAIPWEDQNNAGCRLCAWFFCREVG